MTMLETAKEFQEACDMGKGWEGCSQFCASNATFSVQAEALAGIDTLEGYVDWAKGILTPLPNGSYEVKSFAIDEERGNVSVYAVFMGTHTGEGGPVPPTGRSTSTESGSPNSFAKERCRHSSSSKTCSDASRK